MANRYSILANNWASGLVIEDDVDWDVSFRSQLELVALGVQSLLETPQNSIPDSPYGDGWDLMWLGHCASIPVEGDNRRFLTFNDPTVTPPERRQNYGSIPDMSQYDNSTRLLYRALGGTCTYGYALSRHGAQKLLKYMSMDLYSQPMDFGLDEMCRKPERGMNCIGLFPQIISDHKPPGRQDRDSDIVPLSHEGERQTGFSWNIVNSMRLNADAVMDGRTDDVVAQWPESMPQLTGPFQAVFTEIAPPSVAA